VDAVRLHIVRWKLFQLSGENTMSDVRFRQVNDYANVHGFVGGFPNFHQADYGCGIVFGTLLIRPGQGEERDVSASDLGTPPGDNWGARFRATNDYANRNGFVGGFPNFHQADYGQGIVYGTLLFRSGAAELRDVSAADLGNPPGDDIGARFRATNDYAVQNGFAAGFPNFHQADHGQGLVYGTILLRSAAVEKQDVLEDAFNIFTNFTFDPSITAAQRATLLERHCFAIHRSCGCGNLQGQERANLMQAYQRPIFHGIESRPGVNASAIVNGNQLLVNFNVLFPQGANEIAQTLIHEMMHCAGYRHPTRRDPAPPMSCAIPNPALFDCPFDGGQYYGTEPLRAEICIAGNQSDVNRILEKATDEKCIIDEQGVASIYKT
jgi:hypothetical protein